MTTKRVAVERLYSLGDYKNIKIISELSDLPEDVDTEFVYKQLFAEIENAYLEYKLFSSDLRESETVEEAKNKIESYTKKKEE